MLLYIYFPVVTFYFQSIIDVPSKVLDKLFWEDVECQPSWNPSVTECQVIPTTFTFSLMFDAIFFSLLPCVW